MISDTVPDYLQLVEEDNENKKNIDCSKQK
jgi:hypothetical protein